MCKDKGANHFLNMNDKEQTDKFAQSIDLIIDTICAPHDMEQYLMLLKKGGTIVVLGGVAEPFKLSAGMMMMNQLTVASSIIGSFTTCQEMIDVCHKKNIYPEVDMIEAKDISECWNKLTSKQGNADAKRYVIDIKKSLQNKDFLPK